MIGKTIFEFPSKEEGGVGFGFKFGMYASSVTEKISGTNISGLIKKMNGEGEATTAILHYFYGAAVAYEESKKTGRVITLADVGDMIETLEEGRVVEIFNESLGLPKNSEAPKETGQT